jgi:hypothetical protein
MTLSLTTSIHADQPLYQQIIKAVEVFTNAKFEGPHTVESPSKGSILTLTWDPNARCFLVEGQVSKYTSVTRGNVLKLLSGGADHFGIILAVANMIPHLYGVCKEEEQRQKEYAVQVQQGMANFLKSFE